MSALVMVDCQWWWIAVVDNHQGKADKFIRSSLSVWMHQPLKFAFLLQQVDRSVSLSCNSTLPGAPCATVAIHLFHRCATNFNSKVTTTQQKEAFKQQGDLQSLACIMSLLLLLILPDSA